MTGFPIETLQLADESESSGSLLMDGTEQTLYSQSSDEPFYFPGGFIDFTNAFPNAEEYLVLVYLSVDGTNPNIIWVLEADSVFAGDEAVGIPFDMESNVDVGNIPTALPKGFYSNGALVTVTIQQTAESDGYQTLKYQFCDLQKR